MNEELLHILILTYNRAHKLNETLFALAKSQLNVFRLTILDNNSTDNTQFICEQHSRNFLQLEYIKHDYNIGAGANVLRAFECARGQYFWILCDDDQYNLSDISDVLLAINMAECDAIFVGKTDRFSWPRGRRVNIRDHAFVYSDFFTAANFLPALIIKREVLSSSIISSAYRNIHTHFPQFVISKYLFDNNKRMWISNSPIVIRGEPEELVLPPLSWLRGWVFLTGQLRPRTLAYKAFHAYYLRGFLPKLIAHDIVMQKIDYSQPVLGALADMFIHGTARLRISILLCMPIALLPASIWNQLRVLYRKIKYGLMKKPKPEGYKIIKHDDPSRY
ncbi:MAG: glycosyltransferase family 2 protein [Proteobacteria bacterium]|nr:glycosyltransferase family 2 protein [Pseudomonadota bacterium]